MGKVVVIVAAAVVMSTGCMGGYGRDKKMGGLSWKAKIGYKLMKKTRMKSAVFNLKGRGDNLGKAEFMNVGFIAAAPMEVKRKLDELLLSPDDQGEEQVECFAVAVHWGAGGERIGDAADCLQHANEAPETADGTIIEGVNLQGISIFSLDLPSGREWLITRGSTAVREIGAPDSEALVVGFDELTTKYSHVTGGTGGEVIMASPGLTRWAPAKVRLSGLVNMEMADDGSLNAIDFDCLFAFYL